MPLLFKLVEISARANAGTGSASRGAAASAARRTASLDFPRANATPCRVMAIDGSVSPIRLNTSKRSRSPGMLPERSPASCRASDRTGPDAPTRRVRSRSKIAASLMRSPYGADWPTFDVRPTTGEAPLGEAGPLNLGFLWRGEPLLGTTSYAFGGNAQRSICESMHVNRGTFKSIGEMTPIISGDKVTGWTSGKFRP